MGLTGGVHAPHGDPRHQLGGANSLRRQGYALVRIGQPGRGQVRDPWGSTCAAANPHVGFGGGGAHLASAQPRASGDHGGVRGTAPQIPDIAATEEPARLQSAFIHGIKRLPVDVDSSLAAQRADRGAADVCAEVTRILEYGFSAGLFEFLP